jgi:hypothetical protein
VSLDLMHISGSYLKSVECISMILRYASLKIPKIHKCCTFCLPYQPSNLAMLFDNRTKRNCQRNYLLSKCMHW